MKKETWIFPFWSGWFRFYISNCFISLIAFWPSVVSCRMTLQAIVEGAMIFYSVYWAFEDNNGRGDDGLGGDIWVQMLMFSLPCFCRGHSYTMLWLNLQVFGTSVYTALIITQVSKRTLCLISVSLLICVCLCVSAFLFHCRHFSACPPACLCLGIVVVTCPK